MVCHPKFCNQGRSASCLQCNRGGSLQPRNRRRALLLKGYPVLAVGVRDDRCVPQFFLIIECSVTIVARIKNVYYCIDINLFWFILTPETYKHEDCKVSKTEINEVEINGTKYVRKDSIKSIDQPSGDYVVVRTYSAGVHAGYLKSEDGNEVTLTDTRRLWYWKGAASLSQVAGEGISNPDSCKFPAAIAEIRLKEVIEVIPCTQKAQSIIEGVEAWKQ